MQPIDSANTAATLTNLRKQVEDTRRAVEAGLRTTRENLAAADRTASGSDRLTDRIEPIKAKKTVAFRAVGVINNLRNTLRNWYTFYNGYDPTARKATVFLALIGSMRSVNRSLPLAVLTPSARFSRVVRRPASTARRVSSTCFLRFVSVAAVLAESMGCI